MTDKEYIFEIVRAIIAIALVATAIYLAIVDRQVPDWLYGFVGLAMGFFFQGVTTRLFR